MATNDVNLQVINSMTQDKMNSLKDADGKIPSLANQIIMTDEEDVNLSQLRTDVVYDMSDPNKNWGYESGIKAGVTVSGKDFSKYNLIIVYVNYANTVQQIGVIDMNFLVDGKYFIAMRSGTQSNSSANFYFCNCYINGSKNSFTHEMNGYISGTTVNQRPDNKDYVVYKIEGVLKSPAMIYTGAELHEGEGISIKDGEISAKGYTAGNGINIANGVISASQTYSASEQFTGNYWIDGKPIYRKCNIITLPSQANKWNYIWTLSSKILTVLKIYSNLYHSYYEQYPDKAELYSNGKELFEQHTSDYFNGKQLYVIIEYIYRD